MDAAQAEKMREREAMENVKLLYHDNMIEMTAVSTACMCVLAHLVLLITFSFVTLYNSIVQYLHHINICNCSVEINYNSGKHESIKYYFSLVGKTIIDGWCAVIG